MWLSLLAPALAQSAVEPARQSYLAATAEMVARVDAVDGATWTFHKQERVEHVLQPRQVLTIKYRRSGDTYLRFEGDVNTGREVLYRPSERPGELLVNPSPLLPTLSLALDGHLARDGERYTVDNLALHRSVDRYRTDGLLLAARDYADFAVVDLGQRLVHGEPGRCWRTTLPKDDVPALYAHQVETCVGDRTHALLSMKAWERVGTDLVLVEDYAWADLRLGAPLSDADFDPASPAYGF